MNSNYLTDRFGSFRYLMEIDGVPRAAFGYCSGLRGVSTVDYFIGDDDLDLLEVADPAYETHIVLAQGFAFDDTLKNWEHRCAEGRGERHDGAIVQIDSFGRERGRWRVRGAWPVILEQIEEQNGGKLPAIETLELAYEGLAQG